MSPCFLSVVLSSLPAHKKPYPRCFSQNLIRPQQPPTTTSSPCSIDIRPKTPNEVPSRLPSTPSEYQACRAKLDAPSKTTPSLSPITQQKHSFSSPVINLIPSLPLNLELNRVSPASSLSSSVPTTPHPTRSFPSSLVKIHRHISKSDISEARWWVKMYESLVWHMQQCEHQPWSYELTFFTRLENMVQCRWYPIIKKVRDHGEKRSISDPMRLVKFSGSHSLELSEGVPIQTIMTRHNVPYSQSSRSTSHHSQILDPAQLVAQAILRRHQLTSGRPLRRKRMPSPGRSSLGCEITLTA